MMKRYSLLFVLILTCVSVVQAEDKPSGKSLAATMDVYVFPKTGQDAAQQSQDEAACYEWATSNVGTDPFQLSKQTAQQKGETDRQKHRPSKQGRAPESGVQHVVQRSGLSNGFWVLL